MRQTDKERDIHLGTNLRSSAVTTACALVGLSAFACSGHGPTGPSAVDPTWAFVTLQRLPSLRSVGVVLSIPEQDLVFFYASYGLPHDCESGCFYSLAVGIRLGQKVGWIWVDHEEGLITKRLRYYNVEAADVALFRQETWDQLKAADSWIFWGAFLPYLAVDKDCPDETLVRIAQLLSSYISEHIAWQLLANPAIESHPQVLQLLACLPSWMDAYELPRARARELLGDSFVSCDEGRQSDIAVHLAVHFAARR